jgi:hypothetical protein
MAVIGHETDNLGEYLEVRPLRRLKRITLEESDHIGEILQATNSIIQPIPMIGADASECEESSDTVQQFSIAFVLRYPELGEDLPPQAHLWDPIDSHVEASFTIYETNDPARIQSFLLVVCTHHVVTSSRHPW